MRSSVDLPQPDGPISETNSPFSIVEVDALERDRVALRERLRRRRCELDDARSCDVLRRAADDELLGEHDGDEEDDAERARR